MSRKFAIEVFRPEFADAAASLIVGIQHDEFGLPISVKDQPDLETIPDFYQVGSGNFWVAISDRKVVGTIALKDIGNREGALRKMFVAPEARGKASGVANALLKTLLASSRAHDLKHIYLGTTDAFHAAHRFYEKHGFRQIPADALPRSFPSMALDTRYYRYDF